VSDPQSAAEKETWGLWAGLTVAGVLAFSLVVGLVVLPLAQAPNAHLDPWTAICRAIGVRPGTPAQPQPPVSATAVPVSQVQWSPHTLQILASADPRPGATIAAAVCANCHGEQGFSMTSDFPRLAGQSPEAIYKQLSDFRSGARYNAQMTPIAMQLAPDQLAQVAAYFGHVPEGPILGRADVRTGDPEMQRLINRGDPSRHIPPCQGCHARGVGGPPEAPVIAGQSAAYIERQLTAYKSGARGNDVYRRMRDIAARLTPEDIKRLAETYQGAY
jgi:cytochrome c553